MFKFSDKNTKTIHHRFSHDFREGKEDDVVSVFLLVTLNTFHTFFSVSIVHIEQANVS